MYIITALKNLVEAHALGQKEVTYRKEHSFDMDKTMKKEDLEYHYDDGNYSSHSEINGGKVHQWNDTYYESDDAFLAVLNRTLETEYVAIYKEKSNSFEDSVVDDVSFDSKNFYVITKNGKLLHFSNSEWGGVQLGDNHT